MRFIVLIVLLVSTFSAVADRIDAKDWLLWKEYKTQLPFHSALTIYPPVSIRAQDNRLTGSIAVPYSMSDDNSRLISEFLVVVIDASGKSHFLQPKLNSVGFAKEQGIAMSLFESTSFTDGDVVVRLYKANNETNRSALEQYLHAKAKNNKGIQQALANLAISAPKLGEVWDVDEQTRQGLTLGARDCSAKWTVVQIYSEGCGFCRKAIPKMNTLNNDSDHDITVIGLVGTNNTAGFKDHMTASNISYPFVAYEGEFVESALLQALGQLGFPTYFVLDDNEEVVGIYVGREFDEWLGIIGEG
ncbi:TlpA family protein disulfide reductase [Idiomarina abyssalis]|uniref:TlpA family protein disulfide reductase n=1 Tax=Idiomarina abyssalis TaxID=86102 RepID=UPI003A921DD1